MAYIGQDIEGGVLEKQTLAFDSVTTTFELDYYSAENGLVVSVGGIIQEPGVAFTVNGKNIVFASAPTQATFVVFIERELTIGTVRAVDYIQYQSGSGNGTTTPVTLNNSVTNPEEIMVSLNGLTQIPTTDYTVSGTTLTFDEAPVAGTEIFILFLRLETTEGVLPSGHTLTNSKIVSLDASKLTGSLPNSFTSDVTPQWHALNSVGMHWMNLENKTKMNLVQSYYDHFEDDTGWVANNAVDADTGITDESGNHVFEWQGSPGTNTAIKKMGTSSLSFDGNNYLKNTTTSGGGPHHSDFGFSGDYTVECWVYQDARDAGAGASRPQGILSNSTNSSTHPNLGWHFTIYGSGDNHKLTFETSTGGASQGHVVAPSAFPLQQWVHIAAVRSGSTLTVYQDGVSIGTGSGGSGYNNPQPLRIGRRDEDGSPEQFKGYIDEIRISHTARYTSNFTPSTTPFTSDADTKVLIHGDEVAAQANTGSENVGRDTTGEYISTNIVGSATEWPYANFADQVFSVSSGAFGDVNSYNNQGNTHTIAKNNDNNYLAWTQSPTNWTHSMMVDYKAAYTWSGIKIGFVNTHAMIKTWRLEYSDDGTNWTIMDQTGSTSASLTGYSLVSDNNVSITTDATGVITNVTNNGGSGSKHGAHITFGTPVTARHLKISVGSYVANNDSAAGLDFFIPLYAPTSTNTVGTLVSTSTTANATVSEASGIMMYADGTNNVSTIGTDLKVHFSSDDGANWTEASSYDNPITFDGTTKLLTLPKTTLTGGTGTAVKMKAEFANQQSASSITNTANDITVYGDVKHSTALAGGSGKIGSSCMKFHGNGANAASELSLANSTDFNFPGDFTVEFWFNFVPSDHSGVGGTIISRRGTATAQIGFRDSSNGQLMIQGPGHNALFGPTGLHDGNWHHVAWVRNGTGTNNIKCYVDGVQELQYSNTSPWFNVTSPLYIGSYGAMESWGGKLDEVRLSDSARYTSAFTPSTTKFTSDANTVVLIQSDTTDGSTVFTDSSSNGYAITVTNVNHMDSTQPVGSSSIVFDGSDDYLQVPNNDIFKMNDFTVELWMYNTESNSNAHIIGPVNHSSGGGWALYCNGNGVMKFNDYANGWNTGDVNIGWSTSTWHHVAVTRKGSTVKMFLNGVEKYSASKSASQLVIGSLNLGIGSDNNTTQSMNYIGHMDEIRISNFSRYNGAFTPSTTKFVTDNQTLLLIHSDDANNSVTFTSDEVKSHIIAPTGDVTHSKGYETGDRTGSITVTTYSGTGTPLVGPTSGTRNFETTIVNGVGVETSTWTPDPHDWFNAQTPINGYIRFQFDTAKTITEAKWYQLASGGTGHASATHGTWKWQGSNDASSWTDIGNSFTFGGGVSVSTNVSGGEASMQTHTELNGNTTAYTYYQLAHVSGATSGNPYLMEIEFASTEAITKKFGTSAISFDGSGDKLEIASSSDFNPYNINFTVDFWINVNSFAHTYDWIIGTTSADHQGWNIQIDQGGGGKINFLVGNGSSWDINTVGSGYAINTGTWYHIALVKNSSAWTMYVDGTSRLTGTSATHDYTSNLEIGNCAVWSGRDFDGYLDEVRISNTARWTSNFTPPSAGFTTDGNTALLLNADNTGQLFTDDSYTTGKQTQLHGWAVNY